MAKLYRIIRIQGTLENLCDKIVTAGIPVTKTVTLFNAKKKLSQKV